MRRKHQMGQAAKKLKKPVKEEAAEVIQVSSAVEEADVDKKKREIQVVNLSKAEAEAISTEDLLKAMTPRISERRALKVLADVLKDGTVTVEEPETLADWTYKAVVVKGVDMSEVTGSKEPKVTLTKANFESLTGEQMAKYIEEHTTEKRASLIMLALIGFGLPLTPVQIVDLSNRRITVEGVELPKTTTSRKRDSVVLVKGVNVNGGK